MSRFCIPPTIIGLSDVQCPCPAFANKPNESSDSGLYISGKIDINISAYGDCGEGSIWQRLAKARQEAIDSFYRDFTAAFATQNKTTLWNFYNVSGSKSKNGSLSEAKRYCGIRISPQSMKGILGTLKEFTIGVTTGGNSEIKIWRGYSSSTEITNIELAYSQPIVLNSGYTDIELTQPFFFDVTGGEHYFVTYELPPNSVPFNNQIINCTCNGQDFSFNKAVYLKGFSIENETESDIQQASFSDNAHGLIMKFQLECDLMKHFCDIVKMGVNSVDYAHLAVAIQYKAAENILHDLKKTGRIDFVTLTGKGSVESEMNYLSGQYGGIIQYLVSIFPMHNFHCIDCKPPKFTMTTQSLLV